jgi:hypothetical protein
MAEPKAPVKDTSAMSQPKISFAMNRGAANKTSEGAKAVPAAQATVGEPTVARAWPS